MNKKYIIGIVVVIVIIVLAILLLGGKEKNNKTEENKPINSNIASFQDQTIEGLKMSGLNMLYEEGSTNITVIIKNTTTSDMYIRTVDMELYDKDGKETGKTYFYIDKTLKPNEENVYQTGFSSDVTNTKSVKYSVVK